MAAECFREQAESFKRNGDKHNAASRYRKAVQVYRTLGDRFNAYRWFKKAIELYESIMCFDSIAYISGCHRWRVKFAGASDICTVLIYVRQQKITESLLSIIAMQLNIMNRLRIAVTRPEMKPTLPHATNWLLIATDDRG
jgi:tetratricopeptide (TPR) repeat protein